MKQHYILFLLAIVTLATSCVTKEKKVARWIAHPSFEHSENQWYQIKTIANLKDKPEQALAQISADSKYWLWVNGELAVREGQLKRGPNPNDTYYDEIDLASFLKEGDNTIAIRLWYYGREGFSHKDSKVAGLYFDCNADGEQIVSDSTWMIRHDKAFQKAEGPKGNYRLPESNIRYNAKTANESWTTKPTTDTDWVSAQNKGTNGCAPWNTLVKRPIPHWKDFGLTKASFTKIKDTKYKVELPYNMQFNFWVKVNASEGKKISVSTDVNGNLNDVALHGEYITKEGVQSYEHPCWLNGHTMILDIEPGIELLEVGYRETGYNSEFDGTFKVSDKDLMRLMKMAKRTLYVTMRDNFMDCPDRERAQWWGDLVLEMEESFYAMDNNALDLSRKAIHELVDWQKNDGVLFSPIPAGNWDKELPQQMLASVGWFGFRHFVQFTGEKDLYKRVYPQVKKYLSLWDIKENGEVPSKSGGWNWSDWGNQQDTKLMEHVWYYLALKGYKDMAFENGDTQEVLRVEKSMKSIKNYVNTNFWTPKGYRSTDYKDEIDDRGNGLAVVAGFADESKFPVLKDILFNIRHASPYMEKYVDEALFMMGEQELALQRIKERYKLMIDSDYTTLWEVFWEGNWSHNHAWSGGPLSLMYKYVAGIEPETPGFKTFHVFPNTTDIGDFTCSFSTVRGNIILNAKANNFEVTVPPTTKAIVRSKLESEAFKIEGSGKWTELKDRTDSEYAYYELSPGEWTVHN